LVGLLFTSDQKTLLLKAVNVINKLIFDKNYKSTNVKNVFSTFRIP